MYQTIVDWSKGLNRCEFCGRRVDEELVDGLCEECYDEIYSDGLIFFGEGD